MYIHTNSICAAFPELTFDFEHQPSVEKIYTDKSYC